MGLIKRSNRRGIDGETSGTSGTSLYKTPSNLGKGNDITNQ